MGDWIRGFIKYGLGISKVPWWLPSTISSFSIIELIRIGIQLDLSVPLEAILNTYTSYLDLIFQYVSPVANKILEFVNLRFGFQLELFEHWKHIFIILVIYLTRLTFVYSGRGWIPVTLLVLYGIMVSFVFSILSGSIDPQTQSFAPIFLTLVIPIYALLVYGFIVVLWRALTESDRDDRKITRSIKPFVAFISFQMHSSLKPTIVSVFFFSHLLLLSSVRSVTNIGPTLFLTYIFGVTLWALSLAFKDTKKRIADGESFGAAYWKTGNAKAGANVFQVFVWALIFITGSAGYNLVTGN